MAVETNARAHAAQSSDRPRIAPPRGAPGPKPYELPENLARFFFGRAASAAPEVSACCSSSEQESCCAAEAKADCCGAPTREGCGCR
jgi:hypothetical protein